MTQTDLNLNSERPRQSRMEAFLSYGFRPFFLFAMIFGATAMALWLGWIAQQSVGLPGFGFFSNIDMQPYFWHAHEMTFGYTVAVITGFFLTAVPGWTSTKPVSGTLLAALVSVWVAGRIANALSNSIPLWVTATVDLAFIPFLLVLVLKALGARPSKRNAIFPPILILLLAANTMTYLDRAGIMDGGMESGLLLGINSILLLITLIGGRVVPSFTTNHLRAKGLTVFSASFLPIEISTVLSMVALVAFDLWAPSSPWVGGAALLAALFHLIRLYGWRGWDALDNPMVWVLHLSYLWLIAGLALKAAAIFTGALNETTALHALTAGAIGSITVAIMTRAGLGHSGRSIKASPALITAYAMISIAALMRVAGPVVMPELYAQIMVISGFIWMTALIITGFIFWPILTTPRPQ